MKKYLFWPYQIYLWLILIPLVVVFTLIASLLAIAVAVLVNPRFSSRHVAMNWARLLAFLTPMWVRVQGAHRIDRRRTFVVVANHSSQFDILALYGWLDLDLKWVIKKELRSVLGVGAACEKVGHIFVDRSNPESAKRTVNDALERMGDGVGMLFFPEGTRSNDGRLLPFKKGAFRIALDQGLPVLPVTLVGTRAIMPARSLRVYPGRVTVVVHEPIETSGLQANELSHLMHRARDSVASALPEPHGA